MRLAMKVQRGFTLVELVMVIVIVGVLSAVAIVRFNPNSFKSAAVVGELAAAIRFAQEKSMSNTGATGYRVTISSSGYAVTQGGTSITHPVTGQAGYTNSWSDATISPTGTIDFNGYGEPTLGAPLTFGGNQVVISATVGSDAQSLTLERITGLVR